MQCDANLLLADVLDVATGQESGQISRKLQALPVEEQRRILRVLDVMIDEAAKSKIRPYAVFPGVGIFLSRSTDSDVF